MKLEEQLHHRVCNQQFSRRDFLRSVSGGAALSLVPGVIPAEPVTPAGKAFPLRGHYLILGRMPTVGLAQWKRILRHMQEDRCNFLILWMGGGFRSRKFPITWQYDREHRNIEKDFARKLIDFGHSLGMRIVLGFTPFAYDGVNQYPLEHPELKAYQQDGHLAKLDGMHCWGYALNPSKKEAQKFMLDYASEMYFDFYPNADGLFIESSDYSTCYCPSCTGHYYEREFEFVLAISQRVWEQRRDATVVVYPHYFSSSEIPRFGRGAEEKYDPRWTLFFTPHSAPIQTKLTGQASRSIYWEPLILETPEQGQASIRKARKTGINGLVFSLEYYTFVIRYPEDGNWHLIGSRLKPFGYDWLPEIDDPYAYPLTRVLRIAFREFSQNPDISAETFRGVLKSEIFQESTPASAVDDLLEWQKAYVTNRGFFTPGPLMKPELLGWQLELGRVTPAELQNYRQMLEGLKRIRRKYHAPIQDPNVKAMLEGIDWVLAHWAGKEQLLETSYSSL